MAWMSMMGADSVAYHFANAAERADDHPGQALEYYASRGETPLEWGGSGARELGLVGPVTKVQFERLFGSGGACDPTTGEQLVKTRRPGMELVIAAHKSVAELGVIGNAEHMHRILDAERRATLDYLDSVTRECGGRRGKPAQLTPTSGLIYAHTRHATSRAGDPNPHDHVLIANVVRMQDERGGWKAATTALWREHLQAATVVGRMAAAAEAARLGYGIERDDGPSGKLRHWRIAGVPEEAMAVHSKRAAEIAAEMGRLGHTSYRAKAVVARDTRAHKRHEPIGNLMRRWEGELESVGWPVERMARAVEEARPRVPGLHLDRWEAGRIVAGALAPDGPLAERKVFARRDVLVALAPELYGKEVEALQRLAGQLLRHPEAVPLVAVPTASERPYATAVTIARERAIDAAVAIEVERRDAPAIAVNVAHQAIAAKEAELGGALTAGQRAAVVGTASSGRGLDLVVGIAGSGKTTALSAVRLAFESDGYRVIGTSTSGQAARTLGRAAGIEPSRTLASLTWRLEHGQLALDDRTVVVLDEAAMTDDRMLLQLLHHAAGARAKVVMVGDHRQLGSVGPGGGFEALVRRHGAAVHVLADNVRQRDPAERAALAQLRDGNVAKAVAFYARRERIVEARDRDEALDKLVERWAADAAKHESVAMYAYRRANVDELNRRAREQWRSMGRLSGAELTAPGGARYAHGDRVVTLAPGEGGKTVTSETGTVVGVNLDFEYLLVRMDDSREIVRLEGQELSAARLALGYAVTVHRSQGSTVERAHALEDGGGRELAYVKMSRATHRSTVYVVADSLDQAKADLRHEWSTDRRLGWVIDTGTPLTHPLSAEASPYVPAATREALRIGRLVAERDAILAVVPPDPTAEIRAAELRRSRLDAERRDLEVGTGRYQDEPLGRAVRELHRVERDVARLERNLSLSGTSRADRRDWQSGLADARTRERDATATVASLNSPEFARVSQEDQQVDRELADLRRQQGVYEDWSLRHAEVKVRLDCIAAEIETVGGEIHGRQVDREWERIIQPESWLESRAVGRDLVLDL